MIFQFGRTIYLRKNTNSFSRRSTVADADGITSNGIVVVALFDGNCVDVLLVVVWYLLRACSTCTRTHTHTYLERIKKNEK